MTRRRLLLPHVRRMTIRAATSLLKLLELFFDSHDLRIGRLLVVLVTSNARGDGDIGSQTPQSARPRDVDVTGRALQNMFALAAVMTEHD